MQERKRIFVRAMVTGAQKAPSTLTERKYHEKKKQNSENKYQALTFPLRV